jgi:hypothetical protein
MNNVLKRPEAVILSANRFREKLRIGGIYREAVCNGITQCPVVLARVLTAVSGQNGLCQIRTRTRMRIWLFLFGWFSRNRFRKAANVRVSGGGFAPVGGNRVQSVVKSARAPVTAAVVSVSLPSLTAFKIASR